jgi:hypothetical protein
MTKEAVKLSIDSEVLEKAKKQIPNLSGFLEECLKQYLGIGPNLVYTSQMHELIEQIGDAQLQLYIMNERSHIEENKKKAAKQEINLAWRKLYTTYRDTRTIDETLLENAVKTLGVLSEELRDIVEVCFVFSRDDEVDVTEWSDVYRQYGDNYAD